MHFDISESRILANQSQALQSSTKNTAAPEIAPQPQADIQNTTPQGPQPGPSTLEPSSTVETPASAPASPYTSERQRLRDLTMPTHPNFDIPSSPPPPPTNSEEAATLAATTKKFERFFELKKNGTHFNQRLQTTSSLRNPSLLPKLMEFAGISVEDSYASTLRNGMAVPVSWPEDCHVEGLIKSNETRERKRMAGRDKVDFVSGSKSGGSSAAGTPKGGGERKSKFDRR